MPLSLTNAPAFFQSPVSDDLRDMLNVLMYAYLDNILIFFSNQEWRCGAAAVGPAPAV